ncbi:MAG: carboxypeptidase regulatory-like domain-containing protein, partial [Clostridia bacterium]|nr:carboxypeptidase regulatory-like domain-containing protein [Clostridia bacterium]
DHGEDAGFTYQSKTTRVATVDKNGLITAKKAGTTVIRVTAFNGVYADCEITVKRAPSSITLSAKAITMFAGQEQPLAYKLSSNSAGSVSYASSDENVAMVDANGVVYAIAAGTAKVKATTFNGKSATCTITVQDPSNNISALRPEGGSIIATVTTIQECTILVEVLDEGSEEVLMHASAPVAEGLQMEDVAVQMPRALPSHYILRAVLQDEDGGDLCSPYVTRRYTAAYEGFESQSPSDFPQDKVLDLGSAGYAVYSSTTYPVNTRVTESNGRYSFVPPAKLQPGYVVIIDGEPVKIDTIITNPDGTVTITEDADIYLADIYDAFHLDETIALRPNQGTWAKTRSGGLDLVEFSSNFSFGPVEIEAKVSMSVTVKAFYDKKFFGSDYFEYEVYTDAQGSISAALTGGVDTADEDYNNLSLVLYNNFIPVTIPGMNMFLTVEVPVDLKAEAKGKAEIGFDIRSGYSYNPEGKATPIQSKEIETEVSFEGEFEMKIGPKVQLNVAIVCLMGKVTAHAGVLVRGELEGVSTNKEFSADKSRYHACDACVNMTVAGFAEFKGGLEYKITEFLKGNIAELKLFSGEWEIGDAFVSVVNDRESIYGGKVHFDWGDCQNMKYRVRVKTQDVEGNEVTGKPVSITGSKTEKLSGQSVMEEYLYPGDYTATVIFEKSTVKNPFTMPEGPLDVTVSESAISISGLVTDNNTGKPISGATVEITLPGGEVKSLTTDKDGRYSIDSLPAGEYSFVFSADNYQPKEDITATYAAGTVNECNAALAPEAPDKSGTPFISTQAWVSGDEVEMGGVGYSNAVVFQMGYTGLSSTGGIAEAVYNFQGKYSSMSFDVGFVEGSWERDAEMTITADGRVIYDKVKLKYEDIARRFTVSLSGVHQLVIHFESHGYDKTRYAIGDISFTKSGTPSKAVRVSKEGYDNLRYLLESAVVTKGDFTMGGYNYRDGYRMKTGYGWNEKDEAKLGLNMRGQYSTFSFDITRMPRDNSYEHYLRSATLTIEVDGVAVYSEMPILWNDLVHPISLNVSGARQVLIKVKSSGYDILNWGIGNIQFS